MTDIERRLRAAMMAAADQPPAALLQGIRHRHRRHLRRVGAACVAVAAAIAVATPPIAHALVAVAPAGRPAASSAGQPAPAPTAAAPGTVLRTCASNNNGTINNNWRAQSVHAGPMWFIGARQGSWRSSQKFPGGRLGLVIVLVAVKQGTTAVLTASPTAASHLRFLPSLGSISYNKRYTLQQGTAGATLVACPADPRVTGVPAGYLPGLTLFFIGYVTDLPRCLPFEVRTPAAPRAVRVTVSARGGTCRQ